MSEIGKKITQIKNKVTQNLIELSPNSDEILLAGSGATMSAALVRLLEAGSNMQATVFAIAYGGIQLLPKKGVENSPTRNLSGVARGVAIAAAARWPEQTKQLVENLATNPPREVLYGAAAIATAATLKKTIPPAVRAIGNTYDSGRRVLHAIADHRPRPGQVLHEAKYYSGQFFNAVGNELRDAGQHMGKVLDKQVDKLRHKTADFLYAVAQSTQPGDADHNDHDYDEVDKPYDDPWDTEAVQNLFNELWTK